jgi:hypothetical protein
MSDYTVRYGCRRRKNPAADYNALISLPNKEGSDDGEVILSVTLEEWGGEPICADCKVGHLRWAEGGYVAFHRICDVCGSHWDLHPIAWGPIRATPEILRQIADRNAQKCETCQEWCDTCEYEGRKRCPAHRNHSHAVQAEYVLHQNHVGFAPLNLGDQIGESGKTWGDFLSLVTPELWRKAEEPERVKTMANMAVVGGAWARRARFY